MDRGEIAELKAWGASAEVLEKARAAMRASGEDAVEVWPENWPAVCLWSSVDTQWNHAGHTGIRTGLKYEGVDVVINRGRYMGADKTYSYSEAGGDIFERLQIMERCALDHWAEERANSAG